MALKKAVEVFGFPTTNYVKPVSIVIDEAGKNDEGINLYRVQMIAVFYTNDTKLHKYDSKHFVFENLLENELTLPSFYGLLMSTKEFEGYEQA